MRKLLQERIEKSNPRRILDAEETNRICKLEVIAHKLKREENVQNRQLQKLYWKMVHKLGIGQFCSNCRS